MVIEFQQSVPAVLHRILVSDPDGLVTAFIETLRRTTTSPLSPTTCAGDPLRFSRPTGARRWRPCSGCASRLSPNRTFYDALTETADRMKDLEGRKAIVLIASGRDTFSKLYLRQDAEDPAE